MLEYGLIFRRHERYDVNLCGRGVLNAAVSYPPFPFHPVPSCAVGPRALIRNAGLAMVLATAMIYPDHLRGYVQRPSSEKSDPGN